MRRDRDWPIRNLRETLFDRMKTRFILWRMNFLPSPKDLRARVEESWRGGFECKVLFVRPGWIQGELLPQICLPPFFHPRVHTPILSALGFKNPPFVGANSLTSSPVSLCTSTATSSHCSPSSEATSCATADSSCGCVGPSLTKKGDGDGEMAGEAER